MKYDEIKKVITATPGVEFFEQSKPVNNLSQDFRGTTAQEITVAVYATTPIRSYVDLNNILKALAVQIPKCRIYYCTHEDENAFRLGSIRVEEQIGELTVTKEFKLEKDLTGPTIPLDEIGPKGLCNEKTPLIRVVTIRPYVSLKHAQRANGNFSQPTYSITRDQGVTVFN